MKYLYNFWFNQFKNFALLLFIISCQNKYALQYTRPHNYQVKADSILVPEPNTQKLIMPYKNKLDSLMNKVLIIADDVFEKKLPTGTLGSMFCDVVFNYAMGLNLNVKPDFCLMNNGGLRIPTIQKGPVSINTAYELMPFENELVIVVLDGKNCKKLFTSIAQAGGAPVSNLKMHISNNDAQNIIIGNMPFDENKSYNILTSDYLANGGDKADALTKATNVISLNIKLRDAFIYELENMNKKGLTLKAPTDERITK
ncbi:MAG: 5'-nucleotidase C-terminal domain-containing protein [Bacteroidia bacterium]